MRSASYTVACTSEEDAAEELTKIVLEWPTLSDAIRRAIVLIVESSVIAQPTARTKRSDRVPF